jgi:hypothetical protein
VPFHEKELKYNELANFYGENTFCLKEKYYICLE